MPDLSVTEGFPTNLFPGTLLRFKQASRRQGRQGLRLDGKVRVMHPKADIGLRRDGPKIFRPVVSAEFVFRMVLRKTAVILCVGSALAAHPQVGDEFLKLDGAAFYFDGDQDLPRVQPDQEVDAVRDVVFVSQVWLQQEVAREPAAFQDEG